MWMRREMKSAFVLLGLFFIFILFPFEVHGEFYRYVDETGVLHYVDELSKVPLKYRDNMKVYREKYDHLPEDEREILLKREIEEAERERMEHIAKQQYLDSLETKVTIKGNQVLVPVILGYAGDEVETVLLLDTGASIVTLHREIADQLYINEFRRVEAMLAGGKVIETGLTQLSYIKVGPIKREDVYASIIEHEGPPVNYKGFLGMNFLRNLEYTIDFKRQVIRWNP